MATLVKTTGKCCLLASKCRLLARECRLLAKKYRLLAEFVAHCSLERVLATVCVYNVFILFTIPPIFCVISRSYTK